MRVGVVSILSFLLLGLLRIASAQAQDDLPSVRLRLPEHWPQTVPRVFASSPKPELKIAAPARIGAHSTSVLAYLEKGQLVGWLPLDELERGAFRLGSYWVYFDGHALQWLRRYPVTAEAATEELNAIGQHPDHRQVERYIAAGEELNRDTEIYMGRHGLTANMLPTTGRRYLPPKDKGNPEMVRHPLGGFKDIDGNRWEWARDPHAGPHWDVQHPDGRHTNVFPNGKIVGKDSFPNQAR